MAALDRSAPLRLLRLGYETSDWIAVFLKSYETGAVAQRVAPVSRIASPRFLAWLRARNAAGSNIYVSTNAVSSRHRTRTREAITAVRHVFLEADRDGARVLARLAERADLPPPSYLLHSSRNRVHIFWRVERFDVDTVEALQKQLARELGTDPAATAGSQLTRLPGFFNRKYRPPFLVTMVYGRLDVRYTPADFPKPVRTVARALHVVHANVASRAAVERARSYLEVVQPAIAGQHGDAHTFRVCCRMARGFALDNEQALALLQNWNARCVPPWSREELVDKLRRARRYGREPLGGLLRP
jgi:hypothetical protein